LSLLQGFAEGKYFDITLTSRAIRLHNIKRRFSLSKKEQCKELMKKFFGPATANMVDSMSEDDCVAKCREKVKGFLGEEKAKEFDSLR